MTEPYVCGTGTGIQPPPPEDPDNNVSLFANGRTGGVAVHWTYPTTNPHAVAHVLLYRGTSSNYAASIQIAVVSGSSYFDRIEYEGVFYYWIQIVTVNGTVADAVGPAMAATHNYGDDIAGQLTGKISEGLLATRLRAWLDDLSLVDANLGDRIFDLQGDGVSFSQTLADVQAGIAATHTYITTEINSRIEGDAAIAEQITLVAAAAGSSIAAVTVNLDAWVGQPLRDGGLPSIGALYTAKVTVNGLVGGFGVFNNGQTIEAGFEVDTFWIGRSAIDKVLPFIVSDGVVYMNKAVIKNADIDTLKIAGKSVTIVESNEGVTHANVAFALTGVTGESYDITIMASASMPYQDNFVIYDNGVAVMTGIGQGLCSMVTKITGVANSWHNYSCDAGGALKTTIVVFVAKR